MNRHQLIDKYNLKLYVTKNTDGETEYNYRDADGDIVILKHCSRSFRFEITCDSGEVISSMEFSNYEDEEKFDTCYKEFKKFWRSQI